MPTESEPFIPGPVAVPASAAVTSSAKDLVLDFIRVLEAGGGSAELRPFLAPGFELTEAPHALAPRGSRRSIEQVLSGADQGKLIVSGQHFDIRRTVAQGNTVVVEAEWNATVLMPLPHWEIGDTITASTCSIFEVHRGQLLHQSSFDCYLIPD
ncbi:nuclear transport factor 2 family protein [Pseudarthrobacter sp. PS3-L1]|uniref:nuclear transport factor 2 family protein n=1 Tax=Pseudarthrobacter sp. PS3-L1 TaxID=3046207 RepID=UPI0024B93EDB|nr:nuclear transport factor 2 family protein [Pseudarthrobacter sp. PS3-L1]MDJ0320134.1 nuclear transport factor 2 family protein [Pseudarthrobacter sp. PS3-L1]